MNSENLNLNIPQPDPEWEYYGLWQDVHTAKADLDKAIKYIAVIEQPDDSTDACIAQMLNGVADLLRNCVEVFDEDTVDEMLEE